MSKINGPRIKVVFHLDVSGIQKIDLNLNEQGCVWEVHGGDLKTKKQIDEWMTAYCKGQQPPKQLPINLLGPSFTARALRELCQVPFGKTITYKELAEKAGSPRAARAVGNACGGNLFPLVIPCHRVVGAGNALGGFSNCIEIKKTLLEFEGFKRLEKN